MKCMAGKPTMVQVLRVKNGANEETTSTIARFFVPPAFHATLGIKMKWAKWPRSATARGGGQGAARRPDNGRDRDRRCRSLGEYRGTIRPGSTAVDLEELDANATAQSGSVELTVKRRRDTNTRRRR